MNRSGTGQWYVIAAAMLWGTTGTAQAFAPVGATSAAVGTVRLVIGGLALALFAWQRGAFQRDGSWPHLSVIVGAVSIAAYQLLFFAGVARTGVAAGTLVGIGSAPILAGLLDILVLRRHPTTRWMGATALAILGSTLLILSAGTMTLDFLGILFAIGAGASYAVYTLIGKGLLQTQSPDAVTGMLFGGGAILLLPLILVVDLSWLLQLRGIFVALHLGIVATALSYVLYLRGLITTPASSAVTLALAEPLTAALLAIVVLGERLPPLAWVGIATIFGGLAILTMGTRKAAIG